MNYAKILESRITFLNLLYNMEIGLACESKASTPARIVDCFVRHAPEKIEDFVRLDFYNLRIELKRIELFNIRLVEFEKIYN
jgi:hypothetical protein